MRSRLILFVALLFAVPLFAQKHTVARIEVVGSVPAGIVKSQSTLEAGHSYSDKDLELAMARLRRLPFVFDARYTIDGETLVIDIDGMSRLFADVVGSGVGYDDYETGFASLGGGGRLFLGSGGVAEGHAAQTVAEGGADSTVADAQYSHYGIGGTPLYATASVSQSFRNEAGFDPDPTLHFAVGYPLTLRQTLSASVTDSGYESRFSFPIIDTLTIVSRGDSRVFDLRWTWDTSEDPFFARNGLTINAGPSWSEGVFVSENIGPGLPGFPGPIVPTVIRSETNSTSLGVDARKFWATGNRGAVFTALGLARTHFEVEQSDVIFPLPDFEADSNSASATLGYAHNLFDRSTNASTRQRLEFGVTYNYQEVDQPFDFDASDDATSLHAAYVLRRHFATVRLNLSYTFEESGLQPQMPADPF